MWPPLKIGLTKVRRWKGLRLDYCWRMLNRPYVSYERGRYIAISYGNQLSDPVMSLEINFGREYWRD